MGYQTDDIVSQNKQKAINDEYQGTNFKEDERLSDSVSDLGDNAERGSGRQDSDEKISQDGGPSASKHSQEHGLSKSDESMERQGAAKSDAKPDAKSGKQPVGEDEAKGLSDSEFLDKIIKRPYVDKQIFKSRRSEARKEVYKYEDDTKLVLMYDQGGKLSKAELLKGEEVIRDIQINDDIPVKTTPKQSSKPKSQASTPKIDKAEPKTFLQKATSSANENDKIAKGMQKEMERANNTEQYALSNISTWIKHGDEWSVAHALIGAQRGLNNHFDKIFPKTALAIDNFIKKPRTKA